MYDVSKKILPCIFKVGEKTRHKFYRPFCLLLHFLWLFASLFWVHKRNRYKERNITSQRTHVPSSAFFYYPFTVFVILYTFQDFNNRWIILASSSGIRQQFLDFPFLWQIFWKRFAIGLSFKRSSPTVWFI